MHTVRRPELHQNRPMPYLSPYHCPVPNSAKFHENIEIPWKWANSAARLKIPCSVENYGPYLWVSFCLDILPVLYLSRVLKIIIVVVAEEGSVSKLDIFVALTTVI